MKKYPQKEWAKRVVKFDVLPVFTPEHESWIPWLEKTLVERLQELDVRSLGRKK